MLTTSSLFGAEIKFRFTDRGPHAVIFIECNTESRVRLYQIKINKYLNEILAHFELFGLSKNVDLESYAVGSKYLGLLVKEKCYNLKLKVIIMKQHKLKLGRSRFVVNPNLPDLSNDATIKRKAENCRKMLVKAGLPENPTAEEAKAFFDKLDKIV